MQTSLAQEFNRLATEAYNAFPQRLDNLVVFSTSSDFPSGKLVFAAPKIAAHLAKNPDAVEEAIKDLCECFKFGKIPNPMDNIRYYNIKTMIARSSNNSKRKKIYRRFH